MKTFHLKLILLLLLVTVLSTVWAQNGSSLSGDAKQNKAVIVTGARFAYPIVQKWIDDYNKTNPNAQIIIESRGSSDPASYDVLIEAYEQDEAIRNSRVYVNIARYVILPVANSKSAFARTYAVKGLNKELINQLYFDDLYADKDKEQKIKEPYTIYTRLQKAGPPIIFTKYFNHEQKDIKGKAIAGADEHLLKALLRDSTSVSYLPLTVIYDHTAGKILPGLTVLPVDLNGNGKVSDEEKFYTDRNSVVQHLEGKSEKQLENVPIGYVHLSVAKAGVKPEAIDFIKWIIAHGQNDLSDFGYLKPEPGKLEKDKSGFFTSQTP